MLYKLDSMYNIGIRDFAIFFDDLVGEQSGKNQANFLNRLQTSLNKKYSDIYPLITVPTEYTRNWMIDDEGKITTYTQEFSLAVIRSSRKNNLSFFVQGAFYCMFLVV